MLRKFLLSLVLVAVTGFTTAQSLNFEWQGTAYANGEKIVCDTLEWGELVQHLQIRNNTDAALNVVIEKEEIQMVDSSLNYFCWGMCYGSNTFVSDPVELAANSVSAESDLAFHQMIDLTGEGPVAGTSIVKYYAYDEMNPEDKVMIEVWFAYEAEGVVDYANNNVFGKAYPNPATNFVNFDYNLASSANASVSIYNLLGQEVMSQVVNGDQGIISFSVADFQEGVYFCNFIVNGQVVKTNKFVVKK
jgi:hypothetical protein